MSSVLAIDIGGTKTAAAVVDSSGRILARSRAATDRLAGPEAAISLALSLGQSLIAEAGPVSGLGLALPGITDSSRGILIESPSAGWRKVAFAERLGEGLGLQAWADNDVKASALAELRFGSGLGPGGRRSDGQVLSTSFLWLTVSTGIGGALVLEGRIREGARGMAGEVGHLVVQEGGAACGCGGRGCLEAEASGTAIGRKAREALAGGARSPILEGLALGAVDAAAVADAARKGDSLALAILSGAGEAIGRALASVAVLLDIEDFVLGGGVSASLDLLAPAILSTLESRVVAAGSRHFRILHSALGYDAALLGAASLAFQAQEKEQA